MPLKLALSRQGDSGAAEAGKPWRASMSGCEMTSMILTSCQTHSVQLCSIVTTSMLFALLLCSTNVRPGGMGAGVP
eukprot:CAMPEP_0174283572 /NCGR_PEP_ID=MMETSP0809-20121228/4288_1 /TAXON_ID=73025 ORGANISM="Eutreptiella gymnastica-like, Strain CCMP1594" /NCGR_SAMPLE_ID=MMETSP0809 /ASSEMBLY_ACC=CAM_ASM_000658 /LENGTH=75 /DNA_ID=CAMNT_0015378595 /DNA_START=246 /DNA_END=469 /DNA_ORIENTATION=-